MAAEPIQVLPGVKVVKIGGQSVIDRGFAALEPVLDEIVAAVSAGVEVLICTGGGTRARSIYSLASDLKLPTGILSALGARVPIQNARIVQTMLASRGGIFLDPDQFGLLPHYFRSGCIPIMGGMAPYGYWEMRDEGSRIPPNRTDAGTFLTAEYVGCQRAIFVKDENGLFAEDPKVNALAKHIPILAAAHLAALDIADVVIERSLLDYLPNAVWCRELQIVNGLKPGETYKALLGDDTRGSLITA